MSVHNLCFEQKYEKKSEFFSENFQFLVVKFSMYLNRRVFVMCPILSAEDYDWTTPYVSEQHRFW